MRKKIPNYFKLLIKKYPEITSGRKNFTDYHLRVFRTVNLVLKYFKKN